MPAAFSASIAVTVSLTVSAVLPSGCSAPQFGRPSVASNAYRPTGFTGTVP